METIITLILMLLGMIPGGAAGAEAVVYGLLRLVQFIIELDPQTTMLILVSLVGLAVWHRLATEELEPESKPVVSKHVSLPCTTEETVVVAQPHVNGLLVAVAIMAVAFLGVTEDVATGGRWWVAALRCAAVDTAMRVNGSHPPAPTDAPGPGVTGPPTYPR